MGEVLLFFLAAARLLTPRHAAASRSLLISVSLFLPQTSFTTFAFLGRISVNVMVLGLLTIAALPTTIGVAEGISSRNKGKDAADDEELMRKFTLECFCDAESRKRDLIHGGRVVLRNEKLYISHNPANPPSFPFTGFYVSYPDPDRTPAQLGLVSFVSSDPPALNWIYIDKSTRNLRFGNRTQSIAHDVGSWGFESGEEGGAGGLTFDGTEGAAAVETDEGWEIRWEDQQGNFGDVRGKRVLNVSLERKFVEEPKEATTQGEVEKKPAGKANGKFEVTSTTVQKEKGSDKPATKTERKIELSRSTQTLEQTDEKT